MGPLADTPGLTSPLQVTTGLLRRKEELSVRVGREQRLRSKVRRRTKPKELGRREKYAYTRRTALLLIRQIRHRLSAKHNGGLPGQCSCLCTSCRLATHCDRSHLGKPQTSQPEKPYRIYRVPLQLSMKTWQQALSPSSSAYTRSTSLRLASLDGSR